MDCKHFSCIHGRRRGWHSYHGDSLAAPSCDADEILPFGGLNPSLGGAGLVGVQRASSSPIGGAFGLPR